MVSLKAICNSIGLSGKISVMEDFFGYPTALNLKDDTDFRVSLLEQVKLLKINSPYINLCIIRVNIEFFYYQLHRLVAMSIFYARKVYAKVGIGIGRISYHYIPEAAEESPELIAEECDLADMADHWSAAGDGIDIFYVLDIYGPNIGLSPTPGSCDKDDWDSGVCIDMQPMLYRVIGYSLAHELGHHLGLYHVDEDPNVDDDPNNLMWPSTPFDPPDPGPNSVKLTQYQVQQILYSTDEFGNYYLNCWIRMGTVA